MACFENAAAHLRSGGRFVIEARVPEIQRLPPGQTVLPARRPGWDVLLRLRRRHPAAERPALLLRRTAWSKPSPIEMRYAWPAELDLMARLAGMRLQHRWAGWRREPFTALSPAHVSVYQKP